MQFQTIVAVEVDPDPTDNIGPQGSAVRQNVKNRTDVVGLDMDAIWSLPAGLEAEVHVLLMDAKFPDDTIVLGNAPLLNVNPAVPSAFSFVTPRYPAPITPPSGAPATAKISPPAIT